MMKKQLIMEKALELFAKQGFEATTVQQITDYCGISKGAFYLSFKSKDELIIALIDHFMMQITADIDYVVKNTNEDQLLYEFFHVMLDSFHQHMDFAKILIKEQMQTFNQEFMLKMHYYNRLIEKIILSMLERLYGEKINQTKYDLVFCIKGFMSMYSELFLFSDVPIDLKLMSQSLVEKTTILATYSSLPFMSDDILQMMNLPLNEEVTQEQLFKMMKQKIEEMAESIEKESLILLKDQLFEPTMPQAIIKGLLENIRNHPHCKWISYLLRRHYQL